MAVLRVCSEPFSGSNRGVFRDLGGILSFQNDNKPDLSRVQRDSWAFQHKPIRELTGNPSAPCPTLSFGVLCLPLSSAMTAADLAFQRQPDIRPAPGWYSSSERPFQHLWLRGLLQLTDNRLLFWRGTREGSRPHQPAGGPQAARGWRQPAPVDGTGLRQHAHAPARLVLCPFRDPGQRSASSSSESWNQVAMWLRHPGKSIRQISLGIRER
jgi:hypothetical protein